MPIRGAGGRRLAALALLLVSAALAQLPPPQAPPPRAEELEPAKRRTSASDSKEHARIDATVFDLQGRSIAGLTAADFTVEADGKPRSIESCAYRTDAPLRLAVVIDDLSLSPPQLEKARTALRVFFAARLRPGDEAAVLRTSAGEGALDRFTGQPDALVAAIGRVRYYPPTGMPPEEAFASGTLGVVRAALEGMRELPGRKALLLISTGLRDAARGNQPAWGLRVRNLAHRASAVFFAVDMGNAVEQGYFLEQGLAAAAKETGGLLLDGGDVAKALDGIARQQEGYYLLSYSAENIFDYAGLPRVSNIVVKVNRQDVVVRARNGVYGSADSTEDDVYRSPDREFERALGEDLVTGGVRARLSGFVTRGAQWQIEGIVHVDARDLTFVKGLDGHYRATLEVSLGLFGDTGVSVKDVARTMATTLGEESFRKVEEHGFDYNLTVAIPRAGSYQLRALVRDAASGRMGSARQFMHAPDWNGGRLVMSSLVLHGELEKAADGTEVTRDPLENGVMRSFKAGHDFYYSYELYNLAADAAKRGSVEITARIFRDGVMVLDGAPMPLVFEPSADPGHRLANGVVRLSERIPGGHYALLVTIADKVAPRSVSRVIDFEVRP